MPKIPRPERNIDAFTDDRKARRIDSTSERARRIRGSSPFIPDYNIVESFQGWSSRVRHPT